MAAIGRFLTGVLLGLAVVALAIGSLFVIDWDSYLPVCVLGAVLLAGGVALVRRDGARVAGVVSGAVVGIGAYVAFLFWLMATWQ